MLFQEDLLEEEDDQLTQAKVEINSPRLTKRGDAVTPPGLEQEFLKKKVADTDLMLAAFAMTFPGPSESLQANPTWVKMIRLRKSLVELLATVDHIRM